MINIDNVIAKLKAISSLGDDEIESFDFIISQCVSSVESRVKDGASDGDERLEMLCAAKANYDIALINDGGEDITSFSAGDLSISRNAGALSSAEKIYNSILADCTDIVLGEGFAFECV